MILQFLVFGLYFVAGEALQHYLKYIQEVPALKTDLPIFPSSIALFDDLAVLKYAAKDHEEIILLNFHKDANWNVLFTIMVPQCLNSDLTLWKDKLLLTVDGNILQYSISNNSLSGPNQLERGLPDESDYLLPAVYENNLLVLHVFKNTIRYFNNEKSEAVLKQTIEPPAGYSFLENPNIAIHKDIALIGAGKILMSADDESVKKVVLEYNLINGNWIYSGVALSQEKEVNFGSLVTISMFDELYYAIITSEDNVFLYVNVNDVWIQQKHETLKGNYAAVAADGANVLIEECTSKRCLMHQYVFV